LSTDFWKDPTRPLYVDLDGTLVRTDLLVEAVCSLLKKNVLYLFLLPVWLARGRAHLKQQIAQRVNIQPATLPYQPGLLEFLTERRRAGGRLILITASPFQFANAVAGHLGLFDQVLASDAETNLKGERKRAAVLESDSHAGFDYAGNSKADLPVWREAAGALVVNPAPGVLNAVRKLSVPYVVLTDAGRNSLRNVASALRLHHWLKNVLVFVPLTLAHRLGEPGLLWLAALSFLSFSLTASGVYLLNDLLDLPSDRRHPSKNARALASGSVSVEYVVWLVPGLLLGAVACASFLPNGFGAALAAYFALTLAYSLRLKHVVMMDVLVLAALYTLRLIGGAAATWVVPSFWLLSFSMFLFLSLALAKRFSELKLHSDKHAGVAIRGYTDDDLPVLAQLGSASALTSVLVLALYINSETVTVLYTHPQVIWLICPLLLYLMSRIWLLANRNKLDEDPVIFIIRDRLSQLLGGIALLLLWIAS
jgi:4-hydroxybenzoate polyprenyltransferase/phosphoserine phosphatase